MPLTKFFLLTGILLAAAAAASGQSVTYATNTITFGYTNRTALLADGWSFIATNPDGSPRNTENTNIANGAVVIYNPPDNPGVLRIPDDLGSILTVPNDSRNSLFRNLSTNWVSMRLKTSFHPFQNHQVCNLVVYQNDDDFVWVGHQFSDVEKVRFEREFTGSFLEHYEVQAFQITATNMTLRMDRDPVTDRISAFFSLDGTNWTSVGTFCQSFVNPQLGVLLTGSPSGFPNCDLYRLDVITQTTPVTPALVVQPQHLVFNSIAGQPCTNVQVLNVVLQDWQIPSVHWTLTNSAPSWLLTSTNAGNTPSTSDVSVNTTGLNPGIYQGVLGCNASGATSAVVNVTLIVNTNSRVSPATWQGGKSGALSVSVDDSYPSGEDELSTNGFAGSYMMWFETPPSFFTAYYQAGMEIGSHTLSHPCSVVSAPIIRGEIEGNVAGLLSRIAIPPGQVISLSWPCGTASTEEQVVAADYFLDARGFNINLLEDPTPYDFMNLKSFNSHGIAPLPPSDFKTIVDAAIAQGKWFNLVLHSTNDDDGAISYSVGKDIWVAPLGSVTKYILQRNRTVITNYVESGSSIQFNFSRLPLDPSSMRSFETAFTTNDLLTFKVGTAGISQVSAAFVNGVETALKNSGGAYYFNALVKTNAQTVVLNLLPNTAPTLGTQTNRTINELTTLVVTNTATDADLPAQTLTYALIVTNTLNGSVQTNTTIDPNGIISWTPTEAQGPGSYVFTTVVTDFATPPLSATNSFTVTVREVNLAPGLPAQPDQTVFETTPLVVINTATDADLPANPLGYTLTVTNILNNNPVTNAVIDANGIITWTPAPAQVPSTNRFTTVVTDTNAAAVNAQNLRATNTFIVVVQKNPLVLPAQTNRTINELTALFVTNNGTVLTNLIGNSWPVTNSIFFTYTNRSALLADGWSFLATKTNGTSRNTEATGPNVGVLFAQTNAPLGIVMRVPCGGGDLFSTTSNNTTNSIFRVPPTNWISARLNLAFAAQDNYEQTHLVLYQDDDNYVEVGLGYVSGEKLLFVQEIAGAPTTLVSIDVSSLAIVSLRLDRDINSGNISAFYSLDGVTWVLMGQTGQSLTNPRLGIWVGAANLPFTTTQLSADLSRFDIVTLNTLDVVSYTLGVTNTVDGSVQSNATIDANGVISWTPTEAQGPGLYAFTTMASDNRVPPLFATNSFTVTVNEVNTAPGLTLPPNTNIVGQVAWSATATATDSDLPTNLLTFALVSGPSGLTVATNGVINWTPSAGQSPGVYTVTVSVTDTNPAAVNATSLSTSNSFQITVTGVNTAPVLPVQNNVTNNELVLLTVTNTATDTDLPANTLTYTLTVTNLADNSLVASSASIDTNGIITWTPGEARGPGSYLLTTVVTDNGTPNLSATNSFIVVVNEVNMAPNLTLPPNTNILEQVAWSATATATDSDLPTNLLTFALVSGPSGLTVATNGVINWTPSEAQGPGVYTVTVSVTDTNPAAVNATSLSTTNSFQITVGEVNTAPVLPVQNNVTNNELVLLTVTNTATDADLPANTLTYSLTVTNLANSSAVTNAAIDTNGIITWTPTEAQGPSTNHVTTVVTDNGTPARSATNSFTVVVNEVNTAPSLALPPNTNILEQVAWSATATATDSDLPTNLLTFALVSGPSGLTVATNGVINWTPSELQGPGVYTVTVSVTDTNPAAVNAKSLSTTNSFQITVSEVNVVPNLTLPPNTNILEQVAWSATATATDSDLPTNLLTFALVSGPSGLTVATNGVINWTPSEAQGPGVYTVTVSVMDTNPVAVNATSLSTTNSFQITVGEVNTAPVLPVQNNVTNNELVLLTVTNTATDADLPANTLTYTLTVTNLADDSVVTNAAIDTNGIITWTPTEAQGPGNYLLTTVVTDNGTPNLSATNSFTVIVDEVNTAPSLALPPNTNILEQVAWSATATASDSDLPTNLLTFALVSGPSGLTVATNGVINWTPTELQSPGVYTVTVSVTDTNPAAVNATGLSTTNSFQITVGEVNTAPVLPVQNNVTNNELVLLTVTNTATDTDLPANTLTYTLTVTNLADNSLVASSASIDTNGIITWTPGEARGPGSYLLTTVVTDNGAPNLSATNSFTVIVDEVNTAPSLALPPNTNILEQVAWSATATATDSDLPTNLLTFALVSGPSGLTVATNGVINWTPTELQSPGVYTVTVSVTDTNPAAVNATSLSTTNSFQITVGEVNTAPVLPVQNNVTNNELVLLTVTNTATDTDLPANTLTYTLTVTNLADNSLVASSASIDTNGIITWTPGEARGPGSYLLTTVVTDNGAPNLSATNSFMVVVDEVNTAPSLALPPNTNILEQVAWSATATASDSDLPTNLLTFALVSGPSGLTVATNGVISWTPTELQSPGVYTVTVSVTDTNPAAVNATSLSTTNSFQITVGEVNTAPVLPVIPTQTFNEQTLLTVTNTATEPDPHATTLGYGLVNPPAGMSISTNGIITWTPSEAQAPSTNTITTVVTNSDPSDLVNPQLTATNSFTVIVDEVNTAPSLTLPPNTNILEQVAWSATATASDSDLPTNLLTFALVSGPSGLTVATNGVINWTPSEAQGPGVYTVTVSVTDTNPAAVNATSLSTTNSFQITVGEVNTAPVLPVQNNVTNNELVLLTVTNTATDADLPANVLTYTLTVTNLADNSLVTSSASIDTNGIITWTPGEARGPGSYLLTTVVTDNGTPNLSATNSFIVVVNEVNTAPSLTLPPNTNILEQVAWSATATATDSDLPTNLLTFALVSGPSGLTVATNGVINWTPGEAQGPGVYTVTVSVTDTNPAAVNATSLSTTNSFQITVGEVNTAPVLPVQNNVTNSELVLLTVTNTATDADLPANTLTYSLTVTNLVDNSLVTSSASIDTNGIITWTPGEARGPGSYLLTTVVTDNGTPNLSATNSFTVIVDEVNTAPSLALPPNTNILEQVAWSATATATDSDLPTNLLTFALVSGPSGLTVATNGVINWTPGEAQGPGVYTVTVSVTDTNPAAVNATSLSTTNSFQITVGEVNTAPVLPVQNNVTNNELVLLTVTNTATDADLPANVLTYTLTVTNLADNSLVTSSASIDTNGIITWTPTEAQGPGSYLLTTVVTDNGAPNLSATNSFMVVVDEVNTAPSLTLPPNTNILEQVAWSATATASDSDLPTNLLTFALVSGPSGLTVATNGVINWTPGEAQGPGVYTVTVSVTDTNPAAVNATSLSTTNSFQITVGEVNTAPVLPVQNNVTNNELVLLTVTNTATDADVPANTLTYTLTVTNLANSSAVTNAAIDSNGIITWTPTEAQGPSTNLVTTVVTDNGTPARSATNSFIVVVNEVNIAPVLPAQSTRTIATLATLTVTNTATDSDVPTNTLSYALLAPPVGAAIDTNGVITWTPLPGQGPSTNTITTVVTDNNPWAVNAQHLSATNSFTVIVTVPTPVFKITSITVSNGVAVITWNSVPGNYYRLLYKNNVLDANWTELAPDILATGLVTSATNVLGGAPQRFYRVELVTYPSLAQPVIRSIVVTNNTVKITWNAVSGHNYRLQFKDNTTDAGWTDVLPEVTAPGSIATTTDSSGLVAQRFYRIWLRQ